MVEFCQHDQILFAATGCFKLCFFKKENSECSWHLEPSLIFYCSQSMFKEEIMKQFEESIMSYKIFVVEASLKKK